jgi:hypothetical protein
MHAIEAPQGEDAMEPNAASSPLWSLKPEPAIADAPVQAEPRPMREPVQRDVLEPQTTASESSTAAPRKGWWQRTFNRAD